MPFNAAASGRRAVGHLFTSHGRLSAALAVGALALAACAEPPKVAQRPVALAIAPSPAESMKTDLVERLAQCESGGQSIYGAGGLYVGPLQFHRTTVVGYYRILYGQQITHRDAVEIAMDRDRAHQLAKDIIFTSGNKVRDWPLCSRKLGLAAEVDRILAMPQ